MDKKIKIFTYIAVSLLIIVIIKEGVIKSIYLKSEEDSADVKNQVENILIDISSEVEKGKIPLFFQYDKRWGNKIYGDDTMKINGCGPTCLSMVVCGLSGMSTYDPFTVAELAESAGYFVDGSGSAWTLMSEGASMLGLTSQEVIFDETHIRQELESGRPIICIMGPGDFTTEGHFIVLCSIDDNGNVKVNDPNSKKRSKKKWNLEKLMPQIRNLWSYSYE
ncbi:MAG: C39 family peptidase [Lachnospiraceae bacterium]|nr:C39 family peptidase [Lachnospiraceae bacterium]